jgi:hypothetical protein
VKRILLLASVAMVLAGCKDSLTALAQDPNALCVGQTSIYETINFERNFGCHYPPPGFQLVPIQGYVAPSTAPPSVSTGAAK